METYQNEDYVNDLTDRVFLIRRELELGKIKIASNLIEGFVSSFEKIRLRADGKVDPATVDGRIRSMGAAVSHFIEREETKKNIRYMICRRHIMICSSQISVTKIWSPII